MRKPIWATLLMCATLVACEPRDTPPKPKIAALLVAAERSADPAIAIAGKRS